MTLMIFDEIGYLADVPGWYFYTLYFLLRYETTIVVATLVVLALAVAFLMKPVNFTLRGFRELGTGRILSLNDWASFMWCLCLFGLAFAIILLILISLEGAIR